MKKAITIFIISFLLANFVSVAQTNEPLTNKRVIELFEKGVSISIIKRKIEESRSNFDVSDDALIQLAEHKVPPEIQDAMVEAKRRSSKADKSTLNDPTAPHESGIYVDLDPSDKIEMKKMFATIVNQGTVDNSAKLIPYVGPLTNAKLKVSLSGSEAKLQISAYNNPPVFYFYFKSGGEKDLGASSVEWGFQNAESPSEFTLINLICKKNRREINTGKIGALGGSSGIDSKQNIDMGEAEEIAPGVYKVTPKEKLPVGEYCFMYGGNTPKDQGQKVFDFGIMTLEQSGHK